MQAKTNTKTNKERAPPPPNPERFGRGVRANFLMKNEFQICKLCGLRFWESDIKNGICNSCEMDLPDDDQETPNG